MNEHFRIFFFNDGLEIWSAVIKTRLNEIFIYFFFTISQKWPKGKFHREEGFSSGKETTISQKKMGLGFFLFESI